MKEAAKNYMDNFENLRFTQEEQSLVVKVLTGLDQLSDTGNTNFPDAIRIWSLVRKSHRIRAPFHLKFYIIQQFNKDGKVVALNERFDPSSIQVQIDEYLKNKK